MASQQQQTLSASGALETLPSDLYSSGITVTITGMIVNGVLIVLKLIGGLFGTSTAMIADAVHSLSDFITDFGVLIGLRFLSKPADTLHPYGHGRLETVVSLVMGFIILVTGAGIMRNAGMSIYSASKGVFPAMPGYIALFMGVLSIVSKEALFHYTNIIAKKTGSNTLRANAWHHRTDALSSVATVLGIGGAILLGSNWTVLDPVAAVIVSLLVLKVGLGIAWNAIRELSDEALSNERRQKIRGALSHVEGIQGFHHLRTRSLGRYATVDAHIQVDPEMTVRDSHNIATEAEQAVRKALGNAAFVTIHVEPGEHVQNETEAQKGTGGSPGRNRSQ